MLLLIRTLSFTIAILSLLLLGNLLGFSILPNAFIVIAVFVLSLTLAILGTRYNQRNQSQVQ
ncbi:hypothetical protein [Planococcus plakortidis]|uniref:hypothetical protein n=1 Tax=Planococcus plakortidis TaxID=1038856 RepID=UPI00385F13E5